MAAAKKCTSGCTKQKSPGIRPLGPKVLVKRLEAETMTAGGILLPDAAKEKPAQGTILALGDGKQLADGTKGDFQVKKGDTVMFTSYAGTEIKVDGEEYMLMDESDILAILA
ncbi:MAG: co-chaperone GroES [Phycisphaerae bacterium]|nr:co-chaperone GroES [Phycisphaerae bacterium]